MDEHHHHRHDLPPKLPRGRLGRLYRRLKLTVLTFLASTGLIAGSSVCPYCGQQTCPINLGQAAGLGLFTALVVGLFTKLGIRKPPIATGVPAAPSSPDTKVSEPSPTLPLGREV